MVSSRIVFGNCTNMKEVPDGSVQLIVTSPPYYNAPFDYPNLFKNYKEFTYIIKGVAKELFRVLEQGRIACFVTDDMLVDGQKFPIVADITRIMIETGFRYRDRIVWVKPKGYTRISRRSGLVLQHPYPMYFYPDNIQESVLIFQKGKFDYDYVKHLPKKVKDASRIDTEEYNGKEWNLSVWNITNVLPKEDRLEKGIAAFPEEMSSRLIKLFTFTGETVLDPFAGSATTLKTAMQLGRLGVGYELDLGLQKVMVEKLKGYKVKLVRRKDAKNLRNLLFAGLKKKSIVKR
ncbi:MAG: site-specific DNA-methyltransferase [Thaumarchaeota archaeon]|nr:site-specific DNA-methyltransferase [Nitrososphaerota archaeon]